MISDEMSNASRPPRDFSRQTGLREIMRSAHEMRTKVGELRRVVQAGELTPEEAGLCMSDLFGEYVANPRRPPIRDA